MDMFLGILVMSVPAIIALAAAAGALMLALRKPRSVSPTAFILRWCGIIALGLITVGIGTCYGMVFQIGRHP